MSVDEPEEPVPRKILENPLYSGFIGPRLPPCYIKTIPHPHSLATPTIVPLGSAAPPPENPLVVSDTDDRKPWFTFGTRANFEVAEIVVNGGLNRAMTEKLLPGEDDTWVRGGSKVTFRSYDELQNALSSARKYGVRFEEACVSSSYLGEEKEIRFRFRDPWKIVTDSLADPTLHPTAMYHSVHKYRCTGGTQETSAERFVDEPNSADTWAKFDDELPDTNDPDNDDAGSHSWASRDKQIEHCLLPLHFWLDDGLVTKRITVHPMVLRPVYQPAAIRNASGNGGGVLLGYMIAPDDPDDPKSRNAADTLEWAQFRMDIYQKILRVVFGSLRERSWMGEAFRCPDGRIRVFHPGILINSLDGKEAAYFNACRAALAICCCPKCLVRKEMLHRITARFKLRTSKTMKAVIKRVSRQTTKGAREDILKEYGLHNTQHFLWGFRFSDPYAAYSYDTLHSDDLGKWRDHLWEPLLDAIEGLDLSGQLARNMRHFPRWPNLKHFNKVTTVHFTDGQSYYDILKCILPCIVQLLPKNDPLVHCIRAYQRYRVMVGMHCMPESRRERLKTFIADYEYWCERVTQKYGKSFDFFKQHAVAHVLKDIWDKGTTNHGSTRPGEGFQQEARSAYAQTNMKEAEGQMSRIDETLEAVARIRMKIDLADKAAVKAAGSDENTDETPVDVQATDHWSFGTLVPGGWINSVALESVNSGSPFFTDFDMRLREFLAAEYPEERITLEDTILIQRFKTAYISYQSREDWRPARDIVRANPVFHQRERYDCFLVNMVEQGLHFARARCFVRCKLQSGRRVDLAIVHMFERSKWKPRTQWAGCEVRNQSRKIAFLSMEYVIRGALLAPISRAAHEPTHILVDAVDADMFLRADNSSL
ncbi:hypothetical protein MKEN_00000400 [Mycena kentingensis (nom. inval.)]|nr:hypothetical protein MKEN_00000400 [Mycena kentingensis (nom. inval.)]